MNTIYRFRAAWAAAVLATAVSPAFGQTRERDIKVTGPRGRSIERDFRSTVGPGGIDRQSTITRNGSTFERDVHISRPPVGGPAFGARGFMPGPPPGRTVIERDVFINNGGYRGGGGLTRGESFGIGAAVGTGAGLLLGKVLSGPAAPPPPAYYVPQPVVVGPPPLYLAPAVVPPPVVYQPPVRYQPPGPVVVDPVGQAIGRLASSHDNSRIEGALVLGRLGDARAVAPLVDRLKNDHNKDVRIAAAKALGQIGDPTGAVVLERATIYDKKQEVRDAAALALAKMPREAPSSAPPVTTSAPATELRPLSEPEAVPPPPTPALRRP